MRRFNFSTLLVALACLPAIFYTSFLVSAAENEVKSTVSVIEEIEPERPVSTAYILPEEAPEACLPVEEPESSPYRDDIVSDGNALGHEYQKIMLDCCKKYDVPYPLLLAIADTESRFMPDAASRTNDYGFMQINKCNHEWLLAEGIDPMTPAGNIEAGAYIISMHLQKYGEMELALMAYNCGAGGAKKLWDAGVYQTDYSRKVMTAYEHWTDVLEE